MLKQTSNQTQPMPKRKKLVNKRSKFTLLMSKINSDFDLTFICFTKGQNQIDEFMKINDLLKL